MAMLLVMTVPVGFLVSADNRIPDAMPAECLVSSILVLILGTSKKTLEEV